MMFTTETFTPVTRQYTSEIVNSLRASSPIWASETSLVRTRERAAEFFGPSLTRSREARFARRLDRQTPSRVKH